MADTRCNLLTVTTLLLTLALPMSSAASERWFRVELLVFAQPGNSNEDWPAVPTLDYPDTARFLIEPTTLATVGNSSTQSVSIDNYGRKVVRDASARGDLPEQRDPAGQAPAAFVLQPRAQLEFRGKAAYMERVAGYRVLFHQSWDQPFGDKGSSPSIVLDRSGDGGPWPQLQGSIRLYLSRYLHLETDLWLNTTGEYLGGDWRMPAPPRGPRSVLDLRASAQPVAAVAPAAEPVDPTGLANVQDATPAADGYPYPFRHAVTMRQKRRMRSLEVHYIDHPMLGIVVKITPLSELEQEPDSAAAEL